MKFYKQTIAEYLHFNYADAIRFNKLCYTFYVLLFGILTIVTKNPIHSIGMFGALPFSIYYIIKSRILTNNLK